MSTESDVLVEDSAVGDILIEDGYSQRFQNILNRGDFYEPNLHIELEKISRSCDVFFDVGARFGYFSMLAESYGCEVLSFEADERFRFYLEENTDSDIYIGRVGSDIDLDDFIEFFPSVILIDVEGDEVEVLESSEDLISSLNPDIFIEMHPWELEDSDYNRIEEILSGYSLSWCNHREESEWFPGVGRKSSFPTYLLRAE